MFKLFDQSIIRALKSSFLIILLFTATAYHAVDASDHYAQSEQAILDEVNYSAVKDALGTLSYVQSSVGEYVGSFGERLDNFFGSEEARDFKNRSKLKVYLPIHWYEGGKVESHVNFKVQIDLPRTNHRWKLFVSSFEEGDENGEVSQTSNYASNSSVTSDSNLNRVGARYMINQDNQNYDFIETGVKFVDIYKPNFFIKYLERDREVYGHHFESRTYKTFYYEEQDGLALEAKFLLDKKMDRRHLLRSQTRATWWQEDGVVDLNQRFIYFTKVNANRATSYYVSGHWTADNQELDFENVDLALSLRERAYQDWLFVELEPKITWFPHPKILSSPYYSFRLQLEMHFYK